MTWRTPTLYFALSAGLHAQEPAASATVVRQPDGGSITFRQLASVPVLPVKVRRPEVLTAEQIATQARREGKPCVLVSLSASVHESGVTVLRCLLHGQNELRAVSNADLRLLAGVGTVETDTTVYSLVLGAGSSQDPLSEEETLAAQLLPAATTPAFALTGGKTSLTEPEQKVLEALEALHHYFDANREALAHRYAQWESEGAARALAARNAPPPPPKQSVIRFWKLPQRAESSSGTSGKQSGGGASQP